MESRPKWLITGGAGYIGSEVFAILIGNGIECLVLDDLSAGVRERVASESLRIGSILDLTFLESIFQSNEIIGVIHLAAKKDVAEAELMPDEYHLVNVIGTENVFSLSKKYNVKHFIFASTAAVYDSNIPMPHGGYNEESPIFNLGVYGNSKILSEKFLTDQIFGDGMKCTILRFFNVAGATAATGWDVNSHNLIPAVLRSLKSGEVFQVFGNDYSTQDGTGVRDYLHVSDLGRAIFHFVTQSESFSEIPLIYNLGTGKGTSVFEVIKCAEVVSGISADISILPRRKGDAAEIFASTEKFYELTGWKMEQSVKSMIQSSWNVMAGD